MPNVKRRNAFQKHRKQLNVSQRKVSLDLAVSEAQIRNIEAGRGNPSAELLFRLCGYFNTKPELLFPDLAELADKEACLHHQ